MTYEQKMAALNALNPNAALHMRRPESWYVYLPSVEIKKGPILSSARGEGKTPEGAVNDCFDQLVNLPSDQYIVRNAGGRPREAFRWNGFMWDRVEESQ